VGEVGRIAGVAGTRPPLNGDDDNGTELLLRAQGNAQRKSKSTGLRGADRTRVDTGPSRSIFPLLIRQLAPQIGVGHSTLHNFLIGATPHPRVWRLLRTYDQRETSATGDEADAPREALAVLTSTLAGERQQAAEWAMLDALETAHAADVSGISTGECAGLGGGR
jgi:hypothetical protein